MTTGYLGLGGNIGDPAATMAKALRALSRDGAIQIAAVSRLYRTPPWGKLDQPAFLNACARIETDLSPEPLLERCLATEHALKRERIERWGPRTIDIDILLLGTARFSSARLTLPHPRITERAFVLIPLAEIAPDLVVERWPLPVWLEGLDTAGIVPLDGDAGWWKD
ncbi:2-amino-4-hydroxy-6-hydroxymethyldihydropteridine diphosphokinase [Aureimonas mangrovi]|uniref:2-amino-4-hydroxy-6- hydroxymethyldihydropteridine diphosphokinase n=1 Tax=Aureimonas mangrovi TaxID=2758041 RepID=UPI002484683A|nr:2-amino-4-hydroxy-6-hydroxymethyldihydropteridine diphosphokinase [Aureimonas mangrovi]